MVRSAQVCTVHSACKSSVSSSLFIHLFLPEKQAVFRRRRPSSWAMFQHSAPILHGKVPSYPSLKHLLTLLLLLDFTMRSICPFARRITLSRRLPHPKDGNAITSEYSLFKSHSYSYWINNRAQKKISAFTVAVKKPPPVFKAGLKEFLLELVVDADLVSFPSSFGNCVLINHSVIPIRWMQLTSAACLVSSS